MTAFKNDGALVQEYVYDFADDGGAIGTVELSAKARKEPIPAGAVIKRYTRKVLTAFTSGGSATVAAGDGSTPTDYEAAAAVAGLTADSLAEKNNALKVSDANTGKMVLTIAVAALTAGKAVYMVEYYNPAG